MTVESATYINGLNAANPDGATSNVSEGDNHLRLIKSTIKATFPNVAGAVTATHTQLSYVTGVTSAIQAQFDSKGAHAGQTWTGTHNFTGATLTAATQTAGTNNTTVATTAFVMAAAGISPWTTIDGTTIRYTAADPFGVAEVTGTGFGAFGRFAMRAATPSIIGAGDTLGEVNWYGGLAGGSASNGAATIQCLTAGSAGSLGTLLDIWTKVDGGSRTRAMRIDDAQRVGIGTGTGAITATLDVNADKIRVRTSKTPSSASDTGNAGDICWDADYVYVCVATDTWKRAALSTWP